MAEFGRIKAELMAELTLINSAIFCLSIHIYTFLIFKFCFFMILYYFLYI